MFSPAKGLIQMRVLMLHNRYRERGGEDSVFESEVALLEANGHTVTTLVFDNSTIDVNQNLISTTSLALSTIWSRKSQASISETIADTKPDVIHFHNTLPLISPSGYYAAKSDRVPVIQSLHNLRLVCPASTCFREGAPCELCVSSILKLPALKYACYRSSRAETAVVSGMVLAHRLRRTWTSAVDRYITASEHAKSILAKGGIPADKISIKPNFTNMTPSQTQMEREGFLLVGRLSPEKGIGTAVRAWVESRLDESFTVVGAGPLSGLVAQGSVSNPAIRTVGLQDKDSVARFLESARALIFPSECYENFPVTLVESFAMGTPVIASKLGAMAEIVEHGRTGLLFTPGDPQDLADKVRWASAHPREMAKMGMNARGVFAAKYSPSTNLKQLVNIYESAIEQSRQSG